MAFDRDSSGPAETPAAERKAAARARLDVASTQGAIRLLRALLVVSVLVPAALFVAVAWYDWREVNAQTHHTATRMAQILREHALKVFESHEFVLDAVDDRIGGLDWPAIAASEDTHRFLARLLQRHEQVSEIAILNTEGKVVSSSGGFPAPAADHSDREHFRVPLEENRGTFVGPPTALRPNWNRLITISRRRSAPDNSFNGVIVVGLSLDRFSAFYRSITSAAENSVTLARPDGAVLVREPPTTTGASRLSPSSGFVSTIRSGGSLYRTVAELDGIERIHAIEKVGQYPVHVSYGLSLAGMYREWKNDLAIFAVFAIGAAAGLCAITWLALRRARAQERVIEQWQDEVHRREAVEQALRQTQKMEALGQLTGGVAHDFNNLLMVVTGNIEVLKKKLGTSGGERQLAAIEAAARHGESLTRQLLTFARRQPVQPQTIDLFNALPRLIDLLRPSLRGDIGLAADVPPDVWPIRVDPGELELAILNIAINARDAMPITGQLSVAVENRTFKGDEPGHERLTGDFVAVAISDTGEGIPPEIVPRVFEPFFTTKGVGKGTGLGLSQVYGFAKQSGGTATIESQSGNGTTVTLYLPRSESFALGEGPPAVPDEPGELPANVLLIEDNGEVAEATKGMLTSLGCTVVRAADASAALRMLGDGLKVDLVLSDIVMPGNFDGVALGQAVRARYDLPVVLATGYSGAAQRVAGEEFPLLIKPYRSDTLRRALRSAMGRSASQPRVEA
jgi:two-component system NtrC family sensor kinase